MAASSEDQFLSDVHVHNFSQKHFNVKNVDNKEVKETYFSRFYFTLPGNVRQPSLLIDVISEENKSSSLIENICVTSDADGDSIVKRRNECCNDKTDNMQNATTNRLENSKSCESSEELGDKNDANYKCTDSYCLENNLHVLTIEHKMETSLSEVGFQVWSGALLMCDYLLHASSELVNAHILDLGSGTGLTSIVAAMFADCVVCSDYTTEIVKMAERNWLRNQGFLFQTNCCQMYFKVLDWTMSYPPTVSGQDMYGITSDQLDLIEKANIYISAEIIYDDELTQAFFQTAYYLLSKSPPKALYMAFEKRIVYSSTQHQVCSPAYDTFQEYLEDLTSVDEGPVRFSVVKMVTDFPQYFHYTRSKNMELWKISSTSSETG